MGTVSRSRDAIPTWYFVVVVVRKADKYLLVHERKHGQTWYLPAGRVEPGETLPDAALRETEEETGVAIALDGIIRVEHRLIPDGARLRVMFTGHAIDDRPPKSSADAHSLEARWVTLAASRSKTGASSATRRPAATLRPARPLCGSRRYLTVAHRACRAAPF